MPSVLVRPMLNHTTINSAAGGTQLIVAAPSNPVGGSAVPWTTYRTSIHRMMIFVGGAATVTLQDTSGAALAAPWTFAAAGFVPFVTDVPNNLEPIWQTGPGLGAQFAMSAAVQLSADVWWQQVP